MLERSTLRGQVMNIPELPDDEHGTGGPQMAVCGGFGAVLHRLAAEARDND